MTNELLALTSLLPHEITEALAIKPFQGKQIFRWLHQKGVYDFDAMSDLSKDLRERLKSSCRAAQLDPVTTLRSKREDAAAGTGKMLFQLPEGDTIESVVLLDRERVTLCVSSQAGCPFACAFCATGQSGFRRNLTAGEIAEQVTRLVVEQGLVDRTPNIVYMGMGEPFRNYDAVTQSIRILMEKDGLNIGARKITVSTVGDVPGIRRFAEEDWQVRLAISLHAANDTLRSKLLPINRHYNLSALIEAVDYYCLKTGRQLSFEWTLLQGVNDSAEDAHQLVTLLRGLPAVVNVIPFNPVEGVDFKAPTRATCNMFCRMLTNQGIQATLRHERGQDIDAACGQLRLRHQEEA